MIQDEKFILQIISILKSARKKIINCKKIIVDEKTKFNYVTNVDVMVQKYLIKELESLIPSSIIAEEGVNDNTSNSVWIIDPIDGTTNFIRGYDYTISLALKRDDEIMFGFVYDIRKNIIYFAEKEHGAYLYKKGNINEIPTLNDAYNYNDKIVIFGIPYDREKIESILFLCKNISSSASDIKRIGPSSLDICRVAVGKADIYFEYDLKEWDYCAALLILNEVGGKLFRINDLFVFATEKNFEMLKMLE